MQISDISSKLNKPLPGKEVQRQMAPFGREVNFPKITTGYRESAVLLTLIQENDEILIPFIKRTQNGDAHSGQISFPGGKCEKNDFIPENTAKRETYEEIGLKPEKIKIIGKLSKLHIPVSMFVVYPFVAIYPSAHDFKTNKAEVEDLVLVKLSDLLNSENKKKEERNFRGKTYIIPYFDVENQKIWGATAMMLNEFLELIKA